MRKYFYFAYGSNMDLGQMSHRCPAATVVAAHTVVDHRRYQIDSRGFATIEPELDAAVCGVLWQVTDQCVESLARYEGVFFGCYRPTRVEVLRPDGNKTKALTYASGFNFKQDRGQRNRPNPGYQENILDWSSQHGHPREYQRELFGWIPASYLPLWSKLTGRGAETKKETGL